MALWPAILCAILLGVVFLASVFVIVAFEGQGLERERIWQARSGHYNARWLLIYRAFWLVYFFGVDCYDVSWHGASAFLWYTQWNFSLVIIFFLCGTLVSSLELWRSRAGKQHNEVREMQIPGAEGDVELARRGEDEEDIWASDEEEDRRPLGQPNGRKVPNGVGAKGGAVPRRRPEDDAGVLEYAVQILFQTCSSSVLLVDTVLWLVLFPVSVEEGRTSEILNFVSYNEHIINAVAMAGEFWLNSMAFPVFRMSYVVIWACLYVLLEWLAHPWGSKWTYFFLEYRQPTSILWYAGLLLLHCIFFGVCYWLSQLKQRSLDRADSKDWLPIDQNLYRKNVVVEREHLVAGNVGPASTPFERVY
ncbi:hypothetical protein KFL_001630060 [Klebsormidium nitens]|uniref:Uncharacterized protein n=1 Tax=Klebsormidium nitens TaxID=105231 RepID=A0A1Y1I6S9_KLENI|nr:hypothetical protein KFL_001630060 [Klebsormidium nitens]|eukprot:GAQ83808.1 hypothetical protein KFL_001630060 [Klebsormidium nitens]